MTPLTPTNNPSPLGVAQDDWSIVSRFAVAAVGSQGTMGLALALGLVSLVTLIYLYLLYAFHLLFFFLY